MTLVEALSKPRDSTSVLKAMPGKLDNQKMLNLNSIFIYATYIICVCIAT